MENKKQRYITAAFIVMMMVASVLAIIPMAGAQTPFEQRVNGAIEDGLQLLRDTQQPDGSWLSDFYSGGYRIAGASMGALCFMDQRDPVTNNPKGYAGLSPGDKTIVDNALAYIVSQQQGDGSFGSTYETGLAMVALADAMETGGPDYTTELQNAVNYFVATQTDEGEGASVGSTYYGGWNYGGHSNHADNSNSQFALIGLRAADGALGGGVVPQSTWDKGILHVQHVQNDPTINEMAWAQDPLKPHYNDGGCLYVPDGWSLSDSGTYGSYGSMTAAGIWNYMLCGLSQSDYQVVRALGWMEQNFDYDENPNCHNWPFYYYGAYTTAKALLITKPASDVIGGLRDPAADGYPEEAPSWYYDYGWYLTETQHSDGSFYDNPNEDPSWTPMEDTAFAILVLEESAGVPLVDTTTTYIGDTSGYVGAVATLSAQLTETLSGDPIEDEQIIFTLQGKTATAITGSDGIATTTMTLDPPAGAYTVQATFAGDLAKHLGPSSDSKPFTVLEIVADLCPDEYRWGSDKYNWDPFPDIFVGRQEVHFVNTGEGDAFNVIASVTNPPINVVATDPDVTLGDIPAGGSAWSSDTFELRTDMTNPQGPDSSYDWRVEYDDADGVHHVVENVPMFCVPA